MMREGMFGPGSDSNGDTLNLTTADWVLWAYLTGDYERARSLIAQHEAMLRLAHPVPEA
jgi:hypothetical protein